MDNYKLIKSKRKTLSLEINDNSEIIVRAPVKCPEKVIEQFVESRHEWLKKHLKTAHERMNNAEKYAIDSSSADYYIDKAKRILPEKVDYWSNIMQLKPSYVRITSAEKRYGSCNSKKGICFSYRLMAYPEKCIDYVVVHELSHLKYMNHSRDFYKLIEKYLSDYMESDKILKHRGEN